MKSRFVCYLVGFQLLAVSSLLFGQSAFTYQGRLSDGGGPANGIYDLQFTLQDAGSLGAQVAGPLTNATVPVSNGLFTVTLDFGLVAFTGANRWLELGVRTNGGASFVLLAPRQFVGSAPQAWLSVNTLGLRGQPIGTNPPAPGTALTWTGTNWLPGAVAFQGNAFTTNAVLPIGTAAYSNASAFATPHSSREVFNVKNYGATGMNDAAQDSPGILAAITALTNAGAGVLYFPPGTYADTNQHVFVVRPGNTVHDPYYRIEGEGMTASTWNYTGPATSGNFLTFNQVWPEVRDLTIGGPGMAVSGLSGVVGTNDCGRASWSHVRMTGWGKRGVHWEGVYGGKIDWCEFDNCFIGLSLPTYCDGFDVFANVYQNVVGIDVNSDDTTYPSENVPGRNIRIYAVGNQNRYAVIAAQPCEVSGYFEANTNCAVALGHDTNFFTGQWTNLWSSEFGGGIANVQVRNLQAILSGPGGTNCVVRFYTTCFGAQFENVRSIGGNANNGVIEFTGNFENRSSFTASHVSSTSYGSQIKWSDGRITGNRETFLWHEGLDINTTRGGALNPADAGILQVIKEDWLAPYDSWTAIFSGGSRTNQNKDTLIGGWGYLNGETATGNAAKPVTLGYLWATGFEATEYDAHYFIGGGFAAGHPVGQVRFYTGMTTGNPSAGTERLNISNAGVEVRNGTLTAADITATGTVTIPALRETLVTKTANYTLTAAETICLANGAGLTITLPTAVGVSGRLYTIKLIASGTTATVATTNAQTIDGAANLLLAAQYRYVTVVSDGANWQVIAGN